MIHKYNRRLENGQSLVETSLGMLFVLVFFLGLLDLGRLYYIYVALEDSAGEAALYLSLFPECPTDTGGTCAGTQNAEYRAKHASGADINWTNVTYVYSMPDPYGVGDSVTVTLEYNFELLTPIISQIASATNLTLTSSASQTIIAEN